MASRLALDAHTGATQHLAPLSAAGDSSTTTLQITDSNSTTRMIEGFGSQADENIQLNNGNGGETFRAPCSGTNCP